MQLIYLKCESDDYQEFVKLRTYSRWLKVGLVMLSMAVFSVEMYFIVSAFIQKNTFEIGSSQ
jgi:hypothetical protein